MDYETEQFLMKISQHFCDGTLDYDDFYEFVRLAKEESVPEAAILLNKMLEDLKIDQEELNIGEDNIDEEIDAYASLLYHYSNLSSSVRDAYAGGLDNFGFITRNITSFVYGLFSKANNKFSHVDILKLAAYLDLKYYIESNDLEIDYVCEKIEIALDENALDFGEGFYNLDDLIDDDDYSLSATLLRLVSILLCLIFKVDNPEVDEDEIVSSIKQKFDYIKDLIEDMLNDESTFMKDEPIRRSIDSLLKNDELIQSILGSDLDTSDYEIDDIDDYDFIDFSYNIAGTDFTVKKALAFLNEIDDQLDHRREHDDYVAILREKRSEVAFALKQDYPGLNEQEIIKMKNSIELGNVKTAGICYLFGIEVERNFEECFKLFMKGVEMLDAESAYQISTMYLKSLFVSYNKQKWIEYLSLACKLGEENAISQWKELEENANKYYKMKSAAKLQREKEIYKAQAIEANKRTIAPVIVFWSLFLLCIIIGIAMAVSIGTPAIMFFLFAVPFLILGIVKTIQYVRFVDFINKIKDK